MSRKYFLVPEVEENKCESASVHWLLEANVCAASLHHVTRRVYVFTRLDILCTVQK